MPAGGCESSGDGSASTTCRDAFSNATSRPRTERRVHPSKLSPVLTRRTSLFDGLRQIAIPFSPPVMVPSSFSGSCSGSVDIGVGAAGVSATGAAGIGNEGRREGEKIGRSRVAASKLSGVPQSGLPLCCTESPSVSTVTPPAGAACAPGTAKPQPIVANHTNTKYRTISHHNADLWRWNGIRAPSDSPLLRGFLIQTECVSTLLGCGFKTPQGDIDLIRWRIEGC